MKCIKIAILAMLIFTSFFENSYAISSDQHNNMLNREDYKLSYEFYEYELKKIKELLPSDKYKNLSEEINKNIDLEVRYIQETHPFYDKTRMYAIVYASKALQVNWISDFLKKNKNFSHDQYKTFLKNINLINVYNFVAKTMETPEEFSVVNDLPIQCNYQKDFGAVLANVNVLRA